jgi:8-oxo-dGTP diphosphatase
MTEKLGTCVIVLSKDKQKVLLGKRLNCYKSGHYGLPGGRVEITEQIFECVKRELLEETGLTANSVEYLGVIRELQTDYSFVHFAFVCHDFSGEPFVPEPDKCEAWEWFTLEKIPQNILPGHIAAIDIFLNPHFPPIRDISS